MKRKLSSHSLFWLLCFSQVASYHIPSSYHVYICILTFSKALFRMLVLQQPSLWSTKVSQYLWWSNTREFNFFPNLWLYCLSPSLAIIEVQLPISPTGVSALGSDITLRCSLPPYENLNNLIVNWQCGESVVVHSYYHGRDQLERQSVVYKGQTHLFEDQLTVGNASLRLSGVQLSDQGPYTCDVTDEQGSTQEKLLLLVAGKFHWCCIYIV